MKTRCSECGESFSVDHMTENYGTNRILCLECEKSEEQENELTHDEMHLKNFSNPYVDALDKGVFDAIPKSVWAAIAISAMTCGGDHLLDGSMNITDAVMKEWEVLNLNGIVPQKPRKCNA